MYGRASVEHVLSGPGLVNLHRFTHDGRDCPATEGVAQNGQPAAITASALEARCARCVEALAMFVSIYGAEAGNLALRTLATAGCSVVRTVQLLGDPDPRQIVRRERTSPAISKA